MEVGGSVRNQYQFEIPHEGVLGRHINDLAGPEAGVSHVFVSGYREGNPYTAYLPLAEFLSAPIHDGDQINFTVDRHQPVMMVNVEQSPLGSLAFCR